MSNNFAVSSTNISTALTKQSASLHAYGNDMDEVIGLVTAGTEILTDNASKVARGVKTIGANIVKMAQDTKTLDIKVKGVTKTIQLWNEEGTDILSTYDVLKQIAQYWDDMSDAEKSALAIQQSGKNQLDVYTAVLSNFNNAIKAHDTAMRADGSAIRENTAYMESLEAHTKALRQQYELFLLGEGGLNNFLKTMLDGATSIMKFVNSIGGLSTVIKGLSTIIGTMLVGALLKAVNSFKSLNLGLSKTNSNLLKAVIAFKEARDAEFTFAESMEWASLHANMFSIAIQGAVAVIGILITAYSAWKAKQEEILHSLEESYSKFQDEDTQLRKNIETLQDEKASREDLAEVLESTIDGYNSEYKTLDQLNSKRQEAIDLIEEQRKQNALAQVEEGQAQYKKDWGFLTGQQEYLWNPDQFSDQQTSILWNAGAYNAKNNQELLASFEKARHQMNELGLETKEVNAIILDLSTKINTAKERVDEWNYSAQIAGTSLGETARKLHEEFVQSTLNATNQAEALKEQLQGIHDADELLVNQQEDLTEMYYAFGEQLGLNAEQVDAFLQTLNDEDLEKFEGSLDEAYAMLETYAQGLGDSSELQKEFQNELTELTKPLSDAESAYATINKALEEFTNNGGYSAETIQKLALLGDDWIQILNDSIKTGEISQETLGGLTEKNRQLAVAELQAQACADMQAIAEGRLNEVSPIAQQALSQLSDENTTLAETAQQVTRNVMIEAGAIEALHTAQGTYEGSNRNKAIQEIMAVKDEYQNIINDINSWSITGSTSSSKGGKGGSDSSKDAYLEAFKKEKEALKHQLEMDYISEKEYYDSLSELVERYFGVATGLHEKYLDTYQENEEEIYKGLKSIYDEVKDYLAESVEQSYEDAIKVIEKEEEKVLGTIQKQIDDLKDRKDAHLKSVEKEINALKDQKKTVEDYWDAEIDKIKQANKELEQQNQLLELQKKLAEAKSQKVMVMGEEGTFGLAENEKAVSSAELNLRKYEDELSYEQQLADMEAMRDAQLQNLQGRIDDLQNYYDYLSEYYDNQINALEDYHDKTKEVYQSQIDALQEQLDAFKEGQEEYENIQNAKLANQVMAMDAEAENWNTELANLRNYINQYNAMLTQLGTAGKYVGYSYEAGKGALPTPTPIGGGVPKHAQGIASVANDEVALVGDSPNRELVLGANVNKLGTLMALSKGSGVVNAESTDTLAGVLNSLVSPTASGSASNVTQTFSFGNISLPNVTDANSFVKELSDKFNNYAIQFSSIRE